MRVRPLLRWLRTAARAATLVTLVGAVVLWVRSYARNETFGVVWCTPRADREVQHEVSVMCAQGGCLLAYRAVEARSGAYAELKARGFPRTGLFWMPHDGSPRLAYPRLEPNPNHIGQWLVSAGPFQFATGATRYALGPDQRPASIELAHLSVPLWAVTLVLLLAAGSASRSAIGRRLRRRRGQCEACGYDLRASELVCPECGTSFVRPKGDFDESGFRARA